MKMWHSAINLFAPTLALSGIAAPSVLASEPLVSPSPVVQVEQGRLIGREDGPALAFLDIPYAASPTGQNRWRYR